jgi:protein-disulfide isomerase
LFVSCNKGVGSPDYVVAKVNGEKITVGDLDKSGGPLVYEARKRLFDVRSQELDKVISTKLLEAEAKKKGVTVDSLKAEAASKVPPVPASELDRFFNMAKQRNPGVTKEEIRKYLVERQKMIEQRKMVETLKTKAKIESEGIAKLEPVMPRVVVSTDDDPSQGPKDAKVVMIEFTDFECPFCARAHSTVNRVLNEYKGKIKFVRRDFPLPFHKNAMGAHMAANCSNDQNKYWEYSELVWKLAAEKKLDMAAFNKCLDSKKYEAEINKDMADGSKVGVRGTPAFFINGKMISGARPFEDFKKIIDKEL